MQGREVGLPLLQVVRSCSQRQVPVQMKRPVTTGRSGNPLLVGCAEEGESPDIALLIELV